MLSPEVHKNDHIYGQNIWLNWFKFQIPSLTLSNANSGPIRKIPWPFFCLWGCCLSWAEAPIFCDTWQFNHDGWDKRELQEMSGKPRQSCPRRCLKKLSKKLPLIERSVAFQRSKYGPDLWQASLTNVLPPFRRQFFPAATSRLLLSFLGVGFVRLARLLSHILVALRIQRS